jgi:glycosyltransferase involved in cell wall biosynthesis
MVSGDQFRFLYLGTMFPAELRRSLKYYRGRQLLQYSADAFQLGLVSSIKKCVPAEKINLVNWVNIPGDFRTVAFRSKKRFVRRREISLVARSQAFALNMIECISRVLWYLLRERSALRGAVVMVYGTSPRLLYLASALRKLRFFSRLILVVPDLPWMTNLTESSPTLYKIGKAIERRLFYRLRSAIDDVIVTTAEMGAELRIVPSRVHVVEGVVGSDMATAEIPGWPSGKTIVYTGTLNNSFGIRLLVDAFQEVATEDTVLVFCGAGELASYISSVSVTRGRIIHFGQLCPEKTRYAQKRATILVNPRAAGQKFTRYSFPIKTLEYLRAGRPIVGFRLEGIPEEYFRYIQVPREQSVSGLSAEIARLLALDASQLDRIGEEGRQFFLTEKSEIVVADRLKSIILGCE